MPQLVNTIRKKTTLLLLLITTITALNFTRQPVSPAGNVEEYYLDEMKEFHNKLIEFEKKITNLSSLKILQQAFLSIRGNFKKMAVLTDFYNPFETKLLNGPALKWVEDDNPDVIFEPHGLQVIEEILFKSKNTPDYNLLKKEVQGMLSVAEVFLKEKNLDYKFRDELVFEALHSGIIRLTTLGISGFDSPIAQNSIAEAKSTLESIQTLHSFYKKKLYGNSVAEYDKVNDLLSGSIKYLSANTSFNSFDRLTFIKNYISPIFTALVETRIANNLLPEGDRTSVNPKATTLFDSNTFNINAFSPTARYRPTTERIELGRKLFYDPILSATGKRSCATCHKPELAFTDGLKTALAVDEENYLLRNTPTLWNSALQKRQFYDSRVTVLENQLSDVIHNQEEMKGSLIQSVTTLKSDSTYNKLFTIAYSGEYEKITQYTIANAVSSYMRSLISFNSNFDKYMRGDESKLNAVEKKGFNLFMGKAKCATCHFVPLFNGLAPPFFIESESEVLGVPATSDKKNPVLDTDKGKLLFTKSSIHSHSFKTPTLRNIALTAPYMHNGVYNTLEEVMEFYNNGGGAGLKIAPENQTLPPDKLKLSKKEISSIIAFMKTLTDTSGKW